MEDAPQSSDNTSHVIRCLSILTSQASIGFLGSFRQAFSYILILLNHEAITRVIVDADCPAHLALEFGTIEPS